MCLSNRHFYITLSTFPITSTCYSFLKTVVLLHSQSPVSPIQIYNLHVVTIPQTIRLTLNNGAPQIQKPPKDELGSNFTALQRFPFPCPAGWTGHVRCGWGAIGPMSQNETGLWATLGQVGKARKLPFARSIPGATVIPPRSRKN